MTPALSYFIPIWHTFVRMAVHIGNEIVRVLKERGMTKAHFAERIGRNRVNIYGILRSADCNTAVLRKVSAALEYDFFRLLSDEVRHSNAGSAAEEPAGGHATAHRSPMRIVIELDPSNDEARAKAGRFAADLLGELRG
jgi:hypothetical protein